VNRRVESEDEGRTGRKTNAGESRQILALINVKLALRSTFLVPLTHPSPPTSPLNKPSRPYLLALDYNVPGPIYADYL